MSFDSVYNIASNLIAYLFQEGKIFLPKDDQREINKIKKSDLKKLAEEVLNFEKSTTGIMGAEEFLTQIKTLNKVQLG